MSNLFKYKHKNKKEFKPKIVSEVLKPAEKPIVGPTESINALLERYNKIIGDIRSRFNKGNMQLNPIFDGDLISNLNILHNFLSGFMPDLPPYVSENENGIAEISLRALMDARDYLKNEFDFDPNSVVEDLKDDDNIYYGKYTIKRDGTMWKGNEKIFDPENPDIGHIMAIDFDKMIVSAYPGIHLPFAYLFNRTKEFSNYSTPKSSPTTEVQTPEPGQSNFEWRNKENSLVNPIDNPFYNNLVSKNPYITDKNPTRYIPSTDMTLGDLFRMTGITNYTDNLRNFVTSPIFNPDWKEGVQGSSSCRTKDINYFELMFLMLIGGGNYANKPLPGVNNQYAVTESEVDLTGCERKQYRTGHPMMYSDESKQGLPISVLQILYIITSPAFKTVNVPPLGVAIPYSFKVKKWSIKVKWKKFEVFKGLCVMGFLEHWILQLQEWVSTKIRDMFACNMEYLTPITNSEGAGLDFLSSEDPICFHFDTTLKVCNNGQLDATNRMKAGFYFCTKKDSCPQYAPFNSFYKSNKQTGTEGTEDAYKPSTREDEMYTNGSAVKSIVDTIDNGEQVDSQHRG